MDVGDRVEIIEPGSSFAGRAGTITEIDSVGTLPVCVQLDDVSFSPTPFHQKELRLLKDRDL